MNIQKMVAVAAMIGSMLSLAVVAPATAGTNVTYTGQGFNYDGTTYNLNDERCGLTGQNNADDGSTGQFANWNGAGQPYVSGQPYLVWVLAANGATSAKLDLPSGTVDMIAVGGTFKYASPYSSRDTLVNKPVTANYEGRVRGNVQLVVSHGCKPFTTQGAWCSPGYWRNARDAAWTLTGVARTALFNDTVFPGFYGQTAATGPQNDVPANPTLTQVLNATGANTFGKAFAPYNLNPFNATGAFLTEQIPGYSFDAALIGVAEACPIDNHGSFK